MARISRLSASALMFAPIVLVFMKSIIPSFPFFFRQLVAHLSGFVEDVGGFSK